MHGRKWQDRHRKMAFGLLVSMTAMLLSACGSGHVAPTVASSNPNGATTRTSPAGGLALDLEGQPGATDSSYRFDVPEGAPMLVVRTGETVQPAPVADLTVTVTPEASETVAVGLTEGVPTEQGLAELPVSPTVQAALDADVVGITGQTSENLPPLTEAISDAVGRQLVQAEPSATVQTALTDYVEALPQNAGATAEVHRQQLPATGATMIVKPQPGSWTLTLRGEPVTPYHVQVVVLPQGPLSDGELAELVGGVTDADGRGYYRSPWSWLYWTARGIYMARGWWALIVFVWSNPPLLGLLAVIRAYISPYSYSDRAWDALLYWMATR